MGNAAVIQEGDIQVMSAGTGVQHSEYNNNPDQGINLFQLWLFPNKRNVTPRYDQLPIRSLHQKNAFFQILSPSADDQGVWIHQDARMHMLDADQGQSFDYTLQSPNHGVYLIVIEGEVEVGNQSLSRRDAIGVWETQNVEIKTKSDSELLLVQVPMIQLT
jgi:redox-sensitive bicupin YhaK (pirin superfamily)